MKLLDVYPLFDVEPIRGNGCWIEAKDGSKYLDFYGGHAVISIGHAHPEYNKALKNQIDRLIFYSNSVVNTLQQQVAKRLIEVSKVNPEFRLFMVNSGAEANENAVKFASFSNGRNKFVVLEKGFHGRTAAAISLTQGMKHKTAFNTDFEVISVPINDISRLEHVLKDGSVSAVITEAIQGIGGIHVCSTEYLNAVRKLTKENGSLWIADEIQCGFARSGTFFAFQRAGVEPDIISMAKGMGNGFPVGGVLVDPSIMEVEYGMAGTTFGGNHLACTAVLAVLDVIEKENLLDNAHKMGDYLVEHINKIEGVKEVRGAGLMIGIEMEYPVTELRKRMVFDEKIFTGSSSDKNVIRLLPPLNITVSDCNTFLEGFNRQVARFQV